MKKALIIMAVFLLTIFLFTTSSTITFASEDDWESPVAITSEDDWEAPNAITNPTLSGDADDRPTEEITFDDLDSPISGDADDRPTEEIAISDVESPISGDADDRPTEEIIIGGWDSLTGIFDPGGWGSVDKGVFDPGSWGVQSEGIFAPGGWGMVGMDIEAPPTEAPSGFGLWWRGVKESASLMFTFGADAKAQKRLRFAEERLQLADQIAHSMDGENKGKGNVEIVLRGAQKHLDKIETSRSDWFDASDEDSQTLAGNLVRHNFNREAIMDRIEEKLPEDELDNIRQLRVEGLDTNKRLVNALANENIPEGVKAHLQNVKNRIETQDTEIKQFRLEKKELLDKKKAGNEAAAGQLKQLQKQRLDGVKNRVHSYSRCGIEFNVASVISFRLDLTFTCW